MIQAYLYVFFSKSCCQTKCASNKKLIQDYSARSPCYFIALLLFQHVLTCLGVRCSQHVKFLLQDKDHLDLLWEAALSVTIQVRFCSGLQENSLARNLQSEAVKALGHASLSDSFAVFSRLVKELQTEKVQDGVARLPLCLVASWIKQASLWRTLCPGWSYSSAVTFSAADIPSCQR